MTSSQPWLVVLITAIGTPFLALALCFFVPLCRWLRDPSWWFRDVVIAALLAATVLSGQKFIDDTRATREDHLGRSRTRARSDWRIYASCGIDRS